MSFAAAAFAETSFAHDAIGFVIDSFPIYPFNDDILVFTMNINTLSDFVMNINTEFEIDGIINTGFDFDRNINVSHSYSLNINKSVESDLVR